MQSLLVVGAGVSGSYLYAVARDEFNVTVYERSPDRRGHGCAWACFVDNLDEMLRKLGLRADDYVRQRVEEISVNGIRLPVKSQAIIDKPKLLQDLLPESQIKPMPMNPMSLNSEGLKVNATNVPFGDYKSIPAVEYSLHLEGLDPKTNYFYVNPRKAGYAWLFPLDEKGEAWHAGAAGTDVVPMDLLTESYKFHKIRAPGAFTCSCGRNINVVHPRKVRILQDSGAVSVGEAAGVVSPLSGEGIVPSMRSADLLHSIIAKEMPVTFYEEEMRKRLLQTVEKDHEIWERMRMSPRRAWIETFRYALERWQGRGHVGLFTKLRVASQIVLR